MKLSAKAPEILSQISELLTSSNLVPEGLKKENLTLFYKSDDLEKVVGVIGVEVYGDACLLRSLAVRDDQRNLGIARTLIQEAFEFACLEKCFDVYLITETIGAAMMRYGFNNISRDDVPPEILKSPFFNGICPCSCQIMHKNVKESGV